MKVIYQEVMTSLIFLNPTGCLPGKTREVFFTLILSKLDKVGPG